MTPKNKNKVSLEKKPCKESRVLQQEILDELAKEWSKGLFANWEKYKDNYLALNNHAELPNKVNMAVAHTLSRATAEMLKEVDDAIVVAVKDALDEIKSDDNFLRGMSKAMVVMSIQKNLKQRLRTQSGGGK